MLQGLEVIPGVFVVYPTPLLAFSSDRLITYAGCPPVWCQAGGAVCGGAEPLRVSESVQCATFSLRCS